MQHQSLPVQSMTAPAQQLVGELCGETVACLVNITSIEE